MTKKCNETRAGGVRTRSSLCPSGVRWVQLKTTEDSEFHLLTSELHHFVQNVQKVGTLHTECVTRRFASHKPRDAACRETRGGTQRVTHPVWHPGEQSGAWVTAVLGKISWVK